MRIIILICLLLSCGYVEKPFHYVWRERVSTERVINIWVDPQLEEMDRIAINDAITQWNNALNGNIQLVVGHKMGEDWIILKVGTGQDLPVVAWAGKAEIYLIRSRIQDDWVSGIVLYEIGQLLGSKERLPSNWESYRCLDYKVMERVSIAQRIPMDQLNYCVED